MAKAVIDPNTRLDAAESFVTEHLPDLCRDIVVLNAKGWIPPENPLHVLADMIRPFAGPVAFSMAQSLVKDAAMHKVIEEDDR